MNEEVNSKNIAVFFGSRSPEHDISIITGQLIIAGLKGLGFKVTPIYITKKGEWMIGEELGEMKVFTDSRKKVEDQKKYFEYFLDLENSNGKMVFKKKGLVGGTVSVDLAFPALHGSFGEDGSIQGLFEMLDVPYVGCGVAASSIAMDKVLTKQILVQHNIPTAKFIYFSREDWQDKRGEIISKLQEQFIWPVFIKPAHLGSSIGIAKVKDKDMKELVNRVDVAFYYDDKVLVEEAVENLMDVTCCIIGNKKLTASKLQESVFASELFDFKEKYLTKGGAQTGKAKDNIIIPARLEENIAKQIVETALEVYKILGCSGIARVDFLYNKNSKKFYANEVNPLPGTLYHHLWKASGMELDNLLLELVMDAEERHKEKHGLNYAFASNVLQHLNSNKLKSAKL